MLHGNSGDVRMPSSRVTIVTNSPQTSTTIRASTWPPSIGNISITPPVAPPPSCINIARTPNRSFLLIVRQAPGYLSPVLLSGRHTPLFHWKGGGCQRRVERQPGSGERRWPSQFPTPASHSSRAWGGGPYIQNSIDFGRSAYDSARGSLISFPFHFHFICISFLLLPWRPGGQGRRWTDP